MPAATGIGNLALVWFFTGAQYFAFFLYIITLLLSIFSILVMTQFVLGNFASGFIALVNCIDWVKRQKISSVDGILTALAVSRIGLLWVMLLNWYAIVFNPALYNLKGRIFAYVAWTVSNHCSTWLATSLSMFYVFKIAHFSSRIFLHLKWRVESVVHMILLGASFFLVFHVTVVSINETLQRNVYEGNITQKTKLRDILQLSHVTLFTVADLIPFSMSLTSFLLLIFSLLRHLGKMQLNDKGSQDPSTKVHTKAMQTVISFLLLFAIYFLTLIISVWSSNKLRKEPFLLLFLAVEITYPSVHSFILIWGNRKLAQAFLLFLWQLGCWLKDRK
ncbi:taste receptor type 2 member 31-like [Hippopotamus amphibius kiboko]|uniref:taste receptor type 2 member 31-like n=1 Tax=Hippopotamus amphibius kiboko TaxID=575201 RepID=UPI0025999032|nr:taste receptor type 2 member 31-like [Hippopotamus amphibius kiboko]